MLEVTTEWTGSALKKKKFTNGTSGVPPLTALVPPEWCGDSNMTSVTAYNNSMQHFSEPQAYGSDFSHACLLLPSRSALLYKV